MFSFIFLKARKKWKSGGEKREVCKDTIVHNPAKKVHSWYNKSEKSLRIMVAKVPKPKESAILLQLSLTKWANLRSAKFISVELQDWTPCLKWRIVPFLIDDSTTFYR